MFLEAQLRLNKSTLISVEQKGRTQSKEIHYFSKEDFAGNFVNFGLSWMA